jgi:hypothetical protein
MRKESEESELVPGEIIACRYRVEAHCRTHPLGELYRCRDESREAPAASVLLQRLRREFALPGVQDRLFETRGSASLESPVIADILDYGEDIDGRPFLVTAWSDDASLDAVERPLGFAEAATIVVRVAEALAPLHAQHMLHGGIEPASVLVDDQREVTGLLGFGLAPALAAGADRGRALPLLVAPAYAAPELITGEPLGPETDVYALGILLWELIFGQVPFRGPILRILDAHLNRALPNFELPFDAPSSFGPTLRRMLAKRPVDRFPDAGAVAEQLRAHLLERPVLESAAFEPAAFESAVFEPSVVVHRQAWVEPDEDDDETMMFATVRYLGTVPSMQPLAPHAPAVEPVPELPAPSRVLPKLAFALLMCAGLLLLSLWALERDRAAGKSAGVDTERALSSSVRPEPITVEAVTRVPPAIIRIPDRPAPAPAPVPTIAEPPIPLHEQLSPAKFREQKRELYAGISRACTDGTVRRTVKLAVRVDGPGRVDAATVLGKMGSSKLGQCVEQQAKQLEFPASREGGYYVYTLRLRG